MPQIRVAAVSRVNIRLGYDRLVCPKRSSPWQSIGGDSRMRPLSNSAGCPDAMDPERGSVGSGAVVALYRTVAGSRSCASVEVPCRDFLGQSGAYRCSPVPVAPAVPYRAVPRSCARCSPLYWLLPAKTQLPPYGGLREFELKCLRSHPTLLRFYPQALSGAPVLSYS